MKKKKKVCFIINSLSQGGGAERTIHNLSAQFKIRDFDITIILIDKYKVGYCFEDEIKIKSLDFKKDFNFIRVIFQLGEILKSGHFDYVYSFLFRANLFNIFSSKVFNVKPIVISERSFSKHNYNRGKLLSFIIKRVLKFSYSKANTIIAISDGVKESLVNDLKVKANIDVIYNPIILPKVKQDSKKINFKKRYTLITIGRLIESKNQKMLIDVIEILKHNGMDVTLSIVGEGESRKELEGIVGKKKLTDNVIFYGYLKEPELVLKQADLFLFASKYEAFGNVILEAMNEGLPIITFKSEGGPIEILESNKYGVIIEDFSPSKMATTIIEILNDPEEYSRLSQKSLKRVNDFSVEKIAEKYLITYEEAKEEVKK